MKIKIVFILLIYSILLSACLTKKPASGTVTSLPAIANTADIPTPTYTPSPASATPTEAEVPADRKSYSNSEFGFGFQYPASWYGPDEYITEQTLRVEVGSDVVYPYGTGIEERIYTVKNAYYVTIQYSKNDQNQYWKDTYQALAALQDGEMITDARSLTIKVRQLQLGHFEGIEYISTLSETAQTEPVYTRQVILFDEQSNLLTIMGTPNNVDLNGGAGWRGAFLAVDAANQVIFDQIIESVVVQR